MFVQTLLTWFPPWFNENFISILDSAFYHDLDYHQNTGMRGNIPKLSKG